MIGPTLSSLSAVLPRFFPEPWRLTILLRFVTRISPLVAFFARVPEFYGARRRWLVFRSCLSEKHVYRGCQSTDEPEVSEGESSRTGNS